MHCCCNHCLLSSANVFVKTVHTRLIFVTAMLWRGVGERLENVESVFLTVIKQSVFCVDFECQINLFFVYCDVLEREPARWQKTASSITITRRVEFSCVGNTYIKIKKQNSIEKDVKMSNYRKRNKGLVLTFKVVGTLCYCLDITKLF